MKIKIKQHRQSLVAQPVTIWDKTYIHRYDKAIRSQSYMERLLAKIMK